MDDLRKEHPDPKRTIQRNRPKQLQTTYDVKNTNGTNKWKDLTLTYKAVVLFSEKQKGCSKGFRIIEERLYTDQHILNEIKTRR